MGHNCIRIPFSRHGSPQDPQRIHSWIPQFCTSKHACVCVWLYTALSRNLTQVSRQFQNVSHMSGRGEGAAWRLTVYNRVFTRNRAALADQRMCAYTNMTASTFYNSSRNDRPTPRSRHPTPAPHGEKANLQACRYLPTGGVA